MSDQRIVFRMGKQIYLRPLLKTDTELAAIWINDPEITQFIKARYPLTPQDEENWFESIAKRRGEEVILAIVLKDDDRCIGIMGLHKIDYINSRATTGSIIGDKTCWGKGYGTEAKLLLLEYAFNELNLRKICSSVYSTNPRSKRCLEKCGYHEEGILREHIYINGQYIDMHMMAVFKDPFLKKFKSLKKKYLS